MAVAFYDHNEILKTTLTNDERGDLPELKKGKGYIDLVFDRLHLYGGEYFLKVLLSEDNTQDGNKLDVIENAFKLDVLPGDFWQVGKNNRSLNTPIIVEKFNITQ